ncbi:MAG: hypothetical protein ACRDQZ_25565 [Mycobacteriales bacterium]
MSLTNLAALKRYINLKTVNSDLVLAGLIDSQSQAFLDETGRTTFDSQEQTEIRDGMGSDIMQLSFWPVTGFTSLQIDRRSIPLSTQPFQSGYVWNALGKVSLRCFEFCGGRQNVVAVYTAGYLPVDVFDELQTIPAAPASPDSWPQAYTIWVLRPNWQANVQVKFFSGGAILTPVNGLPASGEYYVLGDGGYLFAAADAGKQVLMSYSAAGYPADLVGAVNEMVLLRYRQKDQLEVASMSIAGTVTTYNNADYPKDVWRVIKKYKRYFSVPGF